MLLREERVLEIFNDRLAPFEELQETLADSLSIDTTFVGEKALAELPNASLLGKAKDILDDLSKQLRKVHRNFRTVLDAADSSFGEVRSEWKKRLETVESEYEKILRELQKSKIDGEAFIQLRRQIEELKPLSDKRDNLTSELEASRNQRRDLLLEWEDFKATEYRGVERAAKKVNRKLRGRVQVEIRMGGNREALEKLLREVVGGNLTAAVERLNFLPDLSLPELAATCRRGRDALVQQFNLPKGAAERIAESDEALPLLIEELDLPPTTRIELNTAPEDGTPIWRGLDELSTGQKATAILLLLLLESESPLVVDQPEDDLDNRFITDGVVPIMRTEKRRRQFVFSTHNANIPVLGDAELIVGLAATGEGGEGHAIIGQDHRGSIDTESVRELVEEILEGGKEAFEMRRLKYGF